ncbi:MAG: DUF2835 domain-containing protein [Gammaproteobacteria bacterium]|nr:DUF2835 domain-containing protein [Gammaproteobacteria bacterium]
MNQIRFYLNLSTEKYLSYYQGVARAVSVLSVDGRRLEFPAEHLRRFVTHDGVRGEFLLKFDRNNKYIGLERIGDLPQGGR